MSAEYHKIQSIFKRDPNNKHKSLIFGDYSLREFEYLKDNEWIFTEKVDGTNIRVIFTPDNSVGKITYRGRKDNSQIPASLINRLNEIFYPLLVSKQLIKTFPGGVTLYGEGYGDGIQKIGKFYGPNQDFVLFDVMIDGWWLLRDSVEDIADKLGISVVPVIGKGTIDDMINLVKSGFKSQWGYFIAEGVVARPAIELFTRSGDRIITKLKYTDFPQ